MGKGFHLSPDVFLNSRGSWGFAGVDGLCSLLLLVGVVVVGSFGCQAWSWMLVPYRSHPWEILWMGKEKLPQQRQLLGAKQARQAERLGMLMG